MGNRVGSVDQLLLKVGVDWDSGCVWKCHFFFSNLSYKGNCFPKWLSSLRDKSRLYVESSKERATAAVRERVRERERE